MIISPPTRISKFSTFLHEIIRLYTSATYCVKITLLKSDKLDYISIKAPSWKIVVEWLVLLFTGILFLLRFIEIFTGNSAVNKERRN
jgi:hypothetical protein